MLAKYLRVLLIVCVVLVVLAPWGLSRRRRRGSD